MIMVSIVYAPQFFGNYKPVHQACGTNTDYLLRNDGASTVVSQNDAKVPWPLDDFSSPRGSSSVYLFRIRTPARDTKM